MKFDAIIIGGGRSGMAKATQLQNEGLKCAVITKGRSLYGYQPEEFIKAGGTVLMGDTVTSASIESGRVTAVFTSNLGKVALRADNYYLATGKFFAGGLVADMNRVYEPVFGLDVRYEADPEKWFNEKFSEDQPFMHFGVTASADGCAVKDGEQISNLFPIGEIIAE